MQKVISINLNGNAYQVEEGGYDALIAYLETAQRQLRDNPDRAEILADLEQAIGEKCQRFLSGHKTVVSAAEVDQIIKEMGPVDGPDDAGRAAGGSGAAGDARATTGAPRRLYRIADGAMIAGVCNGIGAYFHVDPTIIRVIFVGLLFLTRGGFALVYFVLAFVLPQANTSEERAAAFGEPFNAQELIDRAKKQYASYKDGRDWRRSWRREQREWRRQWRPIMRDWRWSRWSATPYAPSPAGYTARVFAGVMVPILTLMSVALFWLWLFAIVSLVTRQEVLGQTLPDDVPLWLGIVILVVIYQVVAWPLHMMRRSSYYAIGGAYHGTVAAFDGLLSLGFAMLGIWLAFHYLPEVRELLQRLPEIFRSLRDSVAT
jgi:phage shock protein PspC (stress-responsive transcriptional regulator)